MDFTSIFDGKSLTLEEFQNKTKGMKLVDLSTGDYVEKNKDQDQKAEIARLKQQLAEKDQTIAGLEEAGGDTKKMAEELEKYKRAEADFYTFLNTGSLTGTAATWQSALAKAQGLVLNKFASIRKSTTGIVGFANILDAYDYLGEAAISTQMNFGLTYIKNFMGYSTLFLLPETLGQNSAGEDIPGVAPGKVLATPSENIDLYYIDPSDSEFARLDLNYTTAGETNLIGFHAQGNYSTAVGETYAIMGMKLWAEYLDGIANVSFGDAGGAAVRSAARKSNQV